MRAIRPYYSSVILLTVLLAASCSTKFTATTCGEGLTICGGECVDLDSDRSNCGECGNSCAGDEGCVDGVCSDVECPEGETDCDGTCVDLETDHDNCGACGDACDPDSVCSGGECLDECPEGETECSGSCVDLNSNTSHCGACDNACALDAICVGGVCECLEGEEVCDGACVNVLTDPEHSGRCDFACAIGGLCVDGGCRCPDGEENCSGVCVNTATDPANCGSCGTECAGDEVCSEGDCLSDCPSGQTECSGACVDLTSDRDHCGACDATCADDRDCVSSTCVCRSPLSECGTDCVDLTSDRDNCGTCGTACGSGMVCTSGSCVCTGSLSNCSGLCVDTDTDASNCGSCGTACGSGMACVSGRCVCGSGLTECGGVCVDTGTDTSNCGSCGTVCGSGEVCTAGVCACGTLTGFTNPSFTSTGGWSVSGGAVVATGRAGDGDSGTGFISGVSTCTRGALWQDVCVPGDFSSTGPLALVFSARRDDSSCSYWGCTYGDLMISFDSYSRGTEYIGSSWSTQTVCLGEAAYGGVITTKFWGDYSGTCDPTETYGFEIDQVGIIAVTDGSCPAPGTVLNGDFSAGISHWTPEATGTAEVVPDGGGDRSGHLLGDVATCFSPRLRGKISIPLHSSMPSPAMRMQFAGTSGWEMRVSLEYGGIWHADDKTGVGVTSWTTQYVCLPAEFQGQVLDLVFESRSPGSCTSAPEREFWIDDLVIVSHTSGCP